ncbi:MAG: tRNA pseudouridine(38-40) synthase TruA [Firmicutes bacterium]|nr:tRNA pseudouridine(38-40) synthase TruA [Bacillota bacterium]
MERNILITIEYDGSAYSGWQIQPNVPTVQGEVQNALRRVLGRDIKINGTSRTDAGVHALGQRASFHLEPGIPTERIAFALNNALPGDIRIVSAEEKEADFHARFSAKGKKYIYRMKHHVSAFESRYFYGVEEGLDMDAVHEAAKIIEGTHDFKCFEAAGADPKDSTVRTIWSLTMDRVREDGAVCGGADRSAGYDLVVMGDGFLYNMVRIITGTLVDVGRGRIGAGDIYEMLEKKDRTLAGHTAPPEGLYLAEVFYGEDDQWKTHV